MPSKKSEAVTEATSQRGCLVSGWRVMGAVLKKGKLNTATRLYFLFFPCRRQDGGERDRMGGFSCRRRRERERGREGERLWHLADVVPHAWKGRKVAYHVPQIGFPLGDP